MSTLAEKMAAWGKLKWEMEEIEASIVAEVIALGMSQEYGNVEAKYRKSASNGKYNWERMVSEIEPDIEIIEKHTKIVETIDFKSIAEECGASAELKKRHYTPPVESVPSVTVQLKKN